ncbi:MAG: phage antirepressor protein [Lachnospiraceae bacterium]|nr:phage antirepressor protein [Lachnospiraceae bacterium]
MVFDEKENKTTLVEIDIIKSVSENEIEPFFDGEIRKAWHKQEEEWYFSIVDVCAVLTEQESTRNASTYWAVLKKRLREEGADELLTNCKQLRMPASDGKMRKTDCANIEQIFRIIQSIPSKKAEPFKEWLALVGKERLDEIADPEKAMERAVATYKAKGYSDKWISQRLRSIEIRKELTDEWQNAGINNPKEYAALTNILTMAWSGKSVQAYKELKGLKKENLRDNMTNTELALNLLAEVSTTELSRMQNPKGYNETKDVTISGGEIAGNARKELEKKLGRTVISSSNATEPELLDERKEKK